MSWCNCKSMAIKKTFLLLSTSLIIILPAFASADRGMIPPPHIQLDQSAQNAIVAWDGDEEIIILSSNIKSSATTTVLEVLPLPSQPSDVKKGSSFSFRRLVDIMNQKMERDRWMLGGEGKVADGQAVPGVEVTFHEQIGAHDVTIVKVNDLDDFTDWIDNFTKEKQIALQEVSLEFKQGLANYLKRDIKYFVFDVLQLGEEEKSIEPLVYRFRSDFLYYPILISAISSISDSIAKINLFIVTGDYINLPTLVPYSYYRYSWFSTYGTPVEFTKEELKMVSEDLADLFWKESTVEVREASLHKRLKEITRDLMVFPDLWDKNLGLGDSGKEVENLQKILLNEGVWDSDYEATGYFGEVTRAALTQFQEKHESDILEPLDLQKGTGFLGASTRSYLKKLSVGMTAVAIKEQVFWSRNLSLGAEGDDVKRLQEILIQEGVWTRSDIQPTGYFGPITKQAVIGLQEKYAAEILNPLGLTKGTGFVGPSTREFLNK